MPAAAPREVCVTFEQFREQLKATKFTGRMLVDVAEGELKAATPLKGDVVRFDKPRAPRADCSHT